MSEIDDEIMRSSIPANFTVTTTSGYETPYCSYCGIRLNLEPNGSLNDGMMVTDRVMSGDMPKIGSQVACRVCALDETHAAARVKRKREVRHKGNYIQ